MFDNPSNLMSELLGNESCIVVARLVQRRLQVPASTSTRTEN